MIVKFFSYIHLNNSLIRYLQFYDSIFLQLCQINYKIKNGNIVSVLFYATYRNSSFVFMKSCFATWIIASRYELIALQSWIKRVAFMNCCFATLLTACDLAAIFYCYPYIYILWCDYGYTYRNSRLIQGWWIYRRGR